MFHLKKLQFHSIITIWKIQPIFYTTYCRPKVRLGTDLCLKDKVVMITGGGAGIGAAAALAFAKEGANIALIDKDEENVERIGKCCEELHGATMLNVNADVTVGEHIRKTVVKVIQTFGQLDVLVNNAGILTFGSILEGNLMESYDKAMLTNLRSCVNITVLTAPHLVKTKGNIVNVSSILGRTYIGNHKYMPYSISKAALDHFMYGAALELAPVGVRVNNVCPGATKTDILTSAGVKTPWEEISKAYKIDRPSEPEEVADLIVYLASHKARSITGSTYYIDRGTMLTS